ncbi:hypothetical protein D3C80_1694740 [compost metagenome]
MPVMIVRLREERLTRHERHVIGQRRIEQRPGVQRLLERQPEKQPALGHVPIRQIGKMPLQRRLEGVAALPVKAP